MNTIIKTLTLAHFYAFFMFFTPITNAQIVQNLLIGNAKAIALGNAVTADPPGIDSIHFNPAGLSRLQGRNVQLNLLYGSVDISGEFNSNENYDRLLTENNELDPIANTKSSIDKFAFYSPISGITDISVTAAIFGGASYTTPDQNLTFATSVYSPLVGGYVREENDPGRYFGQRAAISRITFFSPTLSLKVTDEFAIGAGIGFSYVGAGLDIDFRAPNVGIGILKNISDAACAGEDNGLVFEGVPLDLCGGKLSPFESLLFVEVELEKALSTTFNLGFLWYPAPWLTIGAVYQSEAKDKLVGDVRVSLHDNLIGFTQSLANSNPLIGSFIDAAELTKDDQIIQTGSDLTLTLPAHFSIGMSLLITPNFKFNLDWKWSETSSWDDITLNFDKRIAWLDLLSTVGVSNITGTSLTLPRDYEDASNFAYGIEYLLSDRLSFRMGYEPRDTGIPKDKLDFLVPIGNFDLYGLGINYKWENNKSIDIGLAYAKSEQSIPAGSSTNGNNLVTDNIIYNPVAGLDVKSTVEIMLIELTYQSSF